MPNLPSRIIDFSGPCNPFLTETSGEQGYYLTLSYCWGSSKRILTTLQSYEDHCRRIPLHSLPQTFIDAFRVTSALGFRYIWIDALRIIRARKFLDHIALFQTVL